MKVEVVYAWSSLPCQGDLLENCKIDNNGRNLAEEEDEESRKYSSHLEKDEALECSSASANFGVRSIDVPTPEVSPSSSVSIRSTP
jgi:hypothetical protein